MNKDLEVKKEVVTPEDETKEGRTHQKGWVPYGITSFADLEIYKAAREAAGEIYEATDEFQQIIWNIMESAEIEDKGAAILSAAAEFEQLVSDKNDGVENKSLTQRLKEALSPKKKEIQAPPSGFMVYKSEQDGDYRWAAAYSNNFRDSDYPPEIISAESHRSFAKQVDKGQAPMPELWLWHEKDWKIGDADWVGVDELGDGIVVALAAGHFDSDKQWVAEALAKSGMSGVSHGMPVSTLVRDFKDKSIIVAHESREISPLPSARAANKLAGFTTITKENNMIEPNKRDELATALGIAPDRLTEIEESNKARAQKGVAAGLETKESGKQDEPEAKADEAPVETKPETKSEAKPAAPGKPEDEAIPAAVTVDVTVSDTEEIKAAVLTVAQQVKEQGDGLAAILKSITDRLDALEEKDADKIKATAEETPAASFNDLVKSIVGEKGAQVSAKSDLAAMKPKETPVEAESGLPSFLTGLWKE